MEAKRFINDLIADGKHFYYEGNVFHAEKLFIINSVVSWVVDMAKSGEFDHSQVRNYLNVISSFLNGSIDDIFWENGTLYVQKDRDK